MGEVPEIRIRKIWTLKKCHVFGCLWTTYGTLTHLKPEYIHELLNGPSAPERALMGRMPKSYSLKISFLITNQGLYLKILASGVHLDKVKHDLSFV